MVASIPTILLALTSTALGHGYLNNPMPTFFSQYPDITAFCGTMDGPSVLPGDQYNTSPEDNTKAFTSHFKASSYKTLKDLVVAHDGGCGQCGHTDASGKPQELPADGNVYWHHGQEGFTPSHQGPCEVWCDNTRVYQDDNCARNNPNGTMPIDLATCKNSALLTVYWLALHSPSWQIYINCARIAGDAAPSPPSPSKTSTPSSAPTSVPSMSPFTPTPSEDPYTPTPSEDPYTPYPSESPYTPTPSDDPYTSYPSASPYTPPPATPSPSSNGQAQGYSQCGGQNFNGPTQCVSGFHCNKWSEWYSQCVPSESQDRGVPTWGQCGGNGYNGSTNCKSSDVCTRRNDWYSQCVPK
ncbi:hypothetical protein LEN26_016216 [Aphanomyces euteiches]|nr:hypothetical protein LEN26_016216 [Aphanomyces euteiches]KAH9111860.1 hypothetical protein AeMF1_013713 [Aphanomyces euteiches]KAH9188615.1 hypothetical protein AeNC1_009410 [Aphanomyces euteiches]